MAARLGADEELGGLGRPVEVAAFFYQAVALDHEAEPELRRWVASKQRSSMYSLDGVLDELDAMLRHGRAAEGTTASRATAAGAAVGLQPTIAGKGEAGGGGGGGGGSSEAAALQWRVTKPAASNGGGAAAVGASGRALEFVDLWPTRLARVSLLQEGSDEAPNSALMTPEENALLSDIAQAGAPLPEPLSTQPCLQMRASGVRLRQRWSGIARSSV